MAFRLKDLTAECRGVLLSYWITLLFACSTSSQPKRPGMGSGVLRKRCLSALQEFGREERPPNTVVVYPNQVLHYLFYCVR